MMMKTKELLEDDNAAMICALVNMECMYQYAIRSIPIMFDGVRPEHMRSAFAYGLMARGWNIALYEMKLMSGGNFIPVEDMVLYAH